MESDCAERRGPLPGRCRQYERSTYMQSRRSEAGLGPGSRARRLWFIAIIAGPYAQLTDIPAWWRRSDHRPHPALIVGVVGLALSLSAYGAVARYCDRPNVQFALDALGDNRHLLAQDDLATFPRPSRSWPDISKV